MPVYHTVRDGVLCITVDGDYTSGELRRRGDVALSDGQVTPPVSVFLDVSGAASLADRDTATLRETALYFAERRDRIARVAILAAGDLAFGLMRMGSTFAEDAGLQTQVFRTRAEALTWLGASPSRPLTQPPGAGKGTGGLASS